MAETEIHIGDIGTVFEITIMDGVNVINLNSATSLEIIFLDPNDLKITNVAVLSSDGSDGKMRYTITSANELSLDGSWRIQGRVIFSSGTWSTNVDKFKVYENI